MTKFQDPGALIPTAIAIGTGATLFAFAPAPPPSETTTVPTTLADFFGAGTQPGGLVTEIESRTRCDSCHGGYDETHEPFRPWAASPMGQSARDPLFLACLTIANQDAAFAGDLCLRCHTPGGWLAGRSTPTDGSALLDIDFEGINCNFCHRMVDPFHVNGVQPFEDPGILAALLEQPVNPHSGQYVMDPEDRRRGPFDLESFNSHEWRQASFFSDSSNCATCHDVSNPAFSRQPDGTYALNDLNTPHPTQDKLDMFPIERTYSEWTASAFAQGPIEMGGRFGGNLTAVSSCQDCHMPDGTGRGCNRNSRPIRDNLPTHQFNGGNTWIVQAVRNLNDDAVTGLDDNSVAASVARAVAMLEAASDLDVRQEGPDLIARVTNMTGHKLPSGYPEGRRIWVNVEFYDANAQPIAEFGAYDDATATLDTESTVVYETKIGVDAAVSAATGIPEGPGFHFAVNNVVYKDNRIPPMGFTNTGFQAVQAAPVAHTYADGQHWDESSYPIPPDAVSAEVRVYYQLASREYIEFLRDANVTNDAGQVLYDQWIATGKSAPVEMDEAHITLVPVGGCNPADLAAPFGVLNVDDIDVFVNAFLGADLAADCDGSGVLNVDDIDCFVASFLAGCP
ncbi:MAG: GC-type dockerin domain-anchored protein [Phycisphaerales bacterium]